MNLEFKGLELFDGDENIRQDSELVEACQPGRPAWRVYGWTQPWVTVGASQDIRRVFKPEANIGWTRRPTGGKAVLHGHDLTFSMAVCLSDIGVEDRSRQVTEVYLYLIRPIRSALEQTGFTIRQGQGHGKSGGSPDCFAYSSANDIQIGTTKVCGCAQRIYEGVALLQASIPVAPPLVDPDLVFLQAAKPSWLEIPSDKFHENLHLAAESLCELSAHKG